METFRFRILRPILARFCPEMTHTTTQGVIVRQRRSANVCARRCSLCLRVRMCVQICPKTFRSIPFIKNQSYPKIKMPLTCVGDLLTINFDKTINKNLQLQKFAVPLQQQKRTAPKRPPVGSSLTILTTVRRCGRVLCLQRMGKIVGSQVIRTTR